MERSHFHQQQHPHQMANVNDAAASALSSVNRSSPIAIKRAPTHSGDIMAGSSDGDDDSEYNVDDRVIDVEGDALKLRHKYGNNVVQSFCQEPQHLQESRDRARAFLNAPYLGSLVRSTNQLLSLPPMSLAGDTAAMEDPPESLGVYGSLRDSHKRGQFLDGPSSYREPTSGRIHQLDHRVRYHGRTPPEISIGERMQQTRRLKEIKQKELAARGGGDIVSLLAEVASATSGEVTRGPETTTSSLSALMDEASQKISKLTMDTSEPREQAIPLQLGVEDGHGLLDPPRMMLSTSLTAFEVLKSSNTRQKSTKVHSLRGQQTRFSSSMTFHGGFDSQAANGQLAMASQTSKLSTAATTRDNNILNNMEQNVREGFQSLSRSLSDPTHRIQQLYSLRERTALMASPTYGAISTQPPSPLLHFSLPPGHPTQSQFSCTLAATTTSNGECAIPRQADQTDDDDEEEGAFGDIME